MSDQTELGYRPAPEAGQPSETPASGQQVGEQPEYVTRQALKNELDGFYSKLEQSLTDKTVSRIEKKLAKWQNNLKSEGVTVTPAMLDQGRQELAMSELRRLADEDAAALPVPPASGPFTPESVAKVQARMAQLEQEYGVELKAGDDEYDTLSWTDPNQSRFLTTYEEHLKAKIARLKGPTLPPNPARSPGPSGGAANDDLYAQYKKDVERAGTVNERLNVRNKYRSLGLEI